MNVYLGHLSHYIHNAPASTVIRSILDQAQAAGKPAPESLPERTLAVRLPEGTREWLRQQAEAKNCSMAEVIRAYVAEQIVSDLTALYQQHHISHTDFSASLWAVLGYEPGSSPGEGRYQEI